MSIIAHLGLETSRVQRSISSYASWNLWCLSVLTSANGREPSGAWFRNHSASLCRAAYMAVKIVAFTWDSWYSNWSRFWARLIRVLGLSKDSNWSRVCAWLIRILGKVNILNWSRGWTWLVRMLGKLNRSDWSREWVSLVRILGPANGSNLNLIQNWLCRRLLKCRYTMSPKH